jgi:branched-chain amino acid transport system substrate-binding protein
VNEYLTRRDALVAALAATAIGGRALARPRLARAAVSAKVGVILPLSKSAPDSKEANDVLNSARVWADWVNAQGGVGGQHVALQVYDSKGSPEGAARAMVQAVTKDGCAVILGGYNTEEALREIEVAHQYKVPMFVSYAWSSAVTTANFPEVVRIGPNNDILASAFAPFMSKQRYRHVAVLGEDTAFGHGLGEVIRATATLAGIDMNEQTFRRDTSDLRPTLKKVLPRKPDAIVVVGSVPHAARYLGITQARKAGYKGDIVLGWDYINAAFWKATGKLGVGAIWPTFSPPTLHLTTVGQTFKHAFTKKYKHQPLIYQALTWDQLNAWKWAVETTGSVAPADVIPVLPRIDMQGTTGRIKLSNQPGTVHFNQWEGVTVYFDQATKAGATDANAKVLAAIKGRLP